MRALGTKLGVLLVVCLGAFGCSNPIHEIDMAIDCDNLCDRYRDCYDTSYDTGACRSRCHDMVDRDPNVADDCDACFDSTSCIGAAFGCNAECSGLLP